MKEDLDTKGYILIRNALFASEIKNGRDCIDGNKVLYTDMTDFIQNVMIKKLDQEMGWSSEYVKYRVSDNNNSSDASTFHRDILCQNPKKDVYPVYTLLLYLDTTVLELIPGSHKSPVAKYSDAVSTYRRKEKLMVNPGDLLLFSSTMLHRGIFTEKVLHRRLIQVFELFPDVKEYDQYAHKFLHVPITQTALSDLVIFVSKSRISIFILNMYGYLNALTGYGHHLDPFKKYDLSKFAYASSEGLQGRVMVEQGKWQEINKYILQKPVNDFPESYRSGLNFIQYNRQFTLYSVIIIFTIVTFYFCL